jgi:DNA-binding IclR family transcriptional regulator
MTQKQPAISEAPLLGLFGGEAAYRVLMFLERYGQGYAAEVARSSYMALSQAQTQLRKFQELGLLVSRSEGAAKVYYFARSPLVDDLRTFLRSTLARLPDSTLDKYYRERRRPRRADKR